MTIRTAVLLALMVVAWQSVGATTIRVPEDYATIQDALAIAVAGDTVLVGPGWWSTSHPGFEMVGGVTLKSSDGAEVTFITRRVRVAGTTPGTVIEGFTFYPAGSQIICDGSSPLIKGNVFDIQDPCPSYYDYIGVECNNGASPRIEGNVFDGNCGIPETSFIGVDSDDSTPVIIGNEFRDVTSVGGVRISGGGSAARVLSNSFAGCSKGIACAGTANDTIRGNSFSDNQKAISVAGGVGISVIRNTIEDGSIAFDISSQAQPVLRNNSMSNNGTNILISWYSDPAVIDAKFNWWGTTEESGILTSIEYGFNGEGAVVDFDPWCLDPECESTPVLERSWGTLKNMFSSRAE